jgi:hypothetical protein
MEKHTTWIRVAGNATKIKAKDPYGWRCYIEGSPNEIAIKNWSVSGIVDQKNFIPGINATGDEHGLVAWIDCFGFYKIENEVLDIALELPRSHPPKYNTQ